MLKDCCLIFLIKKSMSFITKTCNFFRISIEAKKIHRVLEFNRSKWLKQFFEFNTQKRIQAEKLVTKIKDGKVL